MSDQRGIAIHADLQCELDGRAVQVRTDGEGTLICSLPDMRTLRALRRFSKRPLPLRKIGQSLHEIEHNLEVCIGETTVARFEN